MKRTLTVILSLLILSFSSVAFAAGQERPGYPLKVLGPGFTMSQTGLRHTQGDVIDIGLRAVSGSNPTRYEFYNKATGSSAIYDAKVGLIEPGDEFLISFRYKHEQVKGLQSQFPTSVWFQARQTEDRTNADFPIYIPLDAGEWDGEAAGPRDDTGKSYTKGDYPPNLADKFQYITYTNVIRSGQNAYDVIRPGSANTLPGQGLNLNDSSAVLNALSTTTRQQAGWISSWDKDNQKMDVTLSEGDTLYIYCYFYWDGHGFWQDGRYHSPAAPGTSGAQPIAGTNSLTRPDNDYMGTRMRLEWRMGLSAEAIQEPKTPENPDKPSRPGSTGNATDTPVILGESEPPKVDAPDIGQDPELTGKPDHFTQTPDAPNENTNTSNPPGGNPKTGDDSNIALWATMFAASALGTVVVLIIGRKKKEQRPQ
jgi:hypothetical protein